MEIISPAGAVLRVHTDHPVPFLPLATDVPDEGTPTIAVGYPRVSDVLQMGLGLHASIFPMTISGSAIGRSRTAGLPIPFLQTVGLLNAGSSGGPLVHGETGEIAGLVVQTVPYLEPVKNARGERLGAVMMRAGLSYSIPVSRLRDWLQQNRIPLSSTHTREAPLAPLEKELPTRTFLTTAHLLHLMAGVLHQDRDLLDLAIQHYESALQLEPERPDVLRNLGLAFAAKGEVDHDRDRPSPAYVDVRIADRASPKTVPARRPPHLPRQPAEPRGASVSAENGEKPTAGDLRVDCEVVS